MTNGSGLGRGLDAGSGRGTPADMPKGRMGGFAKGPGGGCVCPSCGAKSAHSLGLPCFEQKCPKCGTAMVRE